MRLVTLTSLAGVFTLSFVLVECRPDAYNLPVPRGLKQASRAEVVARLAGGPDKTRTAKRQVTSPPPSGPCGGPITPGAGNECVYQPYCSTQVVGVTVVGSTFETTFINCATVCTANDLCGSASYQFSTHQCVQYADQDPVSSSDTDFESVIAEDCTTGPPSGPCGVPLTPGSGNECEYQPYCSTQMVGLTLVGTTIETTFVNCETACAASDLCGSASYQFSTRQCIQYADQAPVSSPGTDFESVIANYCSIASGACGVPLTPGGGNDCVYQRYCRRRVLGVTQVDSTFETTFINCANACTANILCGSASYQFSTHQCVQYADQDPVSSPDTDFESVIAEDCTTGPPSGPCGVPLTPGGANECTYQPYCSTMVVGVTQVDSTIQTSFINCATACTANDLCGSATYQFSTHQCVLYEDQVPLSVPNSDFESVIAEDCTVPPTSGPCDVPLTGGTNECVYFPYCRTQVVGTTQVDALFESTFINCVTVCENNDLCGSLSYQYSTNECILYQEEDPATFPNADYKSAIADCP